MTNDKNRHGVEESFGDYLRGRNFRRTPERNTILRRVLSMNKHFNVDELFSALEADGYHVSRSTVYNTIALLTEAGIVRRHQFNNQTAQYEKIVDAAMGNHQHLVCLRCGKVRELKDAELTRKLSERHYQSFYPEYSAVYIYGVCSQCRRKEKKQ